MIDQVIDLPYDKETASVKTGRLALGDIRSAESIEFNYDQENVLCLSRLTLTDADGTSFNIIQECVSMKL